MLLVTRGRKKTCLSLSLNQTLEVLAKSVFRLKHRDVYVEILTLICAAYVVWEVLEKKKFHNSFWLNMTNNEVMVAQKHVVVKVAL